MKPSVDNFILDKFLKGSKIKIALYNKVKEQKPSQSNLGRDKEVIKMPQYYDEDMAEKARMVSDSCGGRDISDQKLEEIMRNMSDHDCERLKDALEQGYDREVEKILNKNS